MFKLLDTRVFIGANLHCGFAAVAGRLQFTQSSPSALTAGELLSRLVRMLPELAAAQPLPGMDDIGLPSDPRAAVGLAVAWLAAQLQNLADAHVSDYALDQTNDGIVHALCGYQVPEVAIDAMTLASALVLSAATGTIGHGLKTQLAVFLNAAVNWHLDQTTHALVSAAQARNIPHFRIGPGSRFVQLGHGIHQHHVFETESDATALTGGKIAHNKLLTGHLLRVLGIPTPTQAAVSTAAQAQRVASRIGFPVVVKPTHGMQGTGVTVGVMDSDQLQEAYQRALAAGQGDVLIENFVPGDDYRLLVINGTLVAAARRIPAHVTGDATHTVEELVAIANQDPRRGMGFSRDLVRLKLDDEADRVLARQGYRRSSVPPAGRMVSLRGTANISTGGTAIEVSDRVHPEVRESAELIARALKLDVAGIDLLTSDIARPCRETGGAISEVNACPGLRPHWVAGTPRATILDPILDMHFPPGCNGRVPMVAITGSAGKTTTSRMVASILRAHGLTTGVATSDGVSVGAHTVREGDCAGGRLARGLLMDPRVEAVVMELARGGLITIGVPFDFCDVATVLNVNFNHIGQDGIDSIEALARVKFLVARSASRCAVLNADDALCVTMARHVHAVPICWVSANPANPVLRAHAAAGGMTAMLSEYSGQTHIAVADGAQQQTIIGVNEIAATMQGLIRVNALNAMFAAAIAHALGIPLESIRAGLAGFRNDFDDNPGRFNFHDGARCRMLLDRPDSPDDMRELCDTLRKISVAGRRIIALTAPGNRLDAHVAGIARQAAGSFDHYVCYSWDDLRGRTPGEVPALLAQHLIANNVPQQAISTVPSQAQAISHALQLGKPGDLVCVVNYDYGTRLRRVWESMTAV